MIIILAVAVITVALAAAVTFAFSIGTRSVAAAVRVKIKDASGQPLHGVQVLLWKDGYPSTHAATNPDGEAVFYDQRYQWTGSMLVGRRSLPPVLPVRLHFPQLSTVYYRFECRPGRTTTHYNVFHSTYDYFRTGNWAGEFVNGDRTTGRDGIDAHWWVACEIARGEEDVEIRLSLRKVERRS